MRQALSRWWDKGKSPGCVLTFLGVLLAALLLTSLLLPMYYINVTRVQEITCADGAAQLALRLEYPQRLTAAGTPLERLPAVLAASINSPGGAVYDVRLVSPGGFLRFTDAAGALLPGPLRFAPGAQPAQQVVYFERVEYEGVADETLQVTVARPGGAPLDCQAAPATAQILLAPMHEEVPLRWLYTLTRPDVVPIAGLVGLLGVIYQVWKQSLQKDIEARRSLKRALLNRIEEARSLARQDVLAAASRWFLIQQQSIEQIQRASASAGENSGDQAVTTQLLKSDAEVLAALDDALKTIREQDWRAPLIERILETCTGDAAQPAGPWITWYCRLDGSTSSTVYMQDMVHQIRGAGEWLRLNNPNTANPVDFSALRRAYDHFQFDCHHPLARVVADLVRAGSAANIWEAYRAIPDSPFRRILQDARVQDAVQEMDRLGSAAPAEARALKWTLRVQESYQTIIFSQRFKKERQQILREFPCGTEWAEQDPALNSFWVELEPQFDQIRRLSPDVILARPGCGKTAAAYWLWETVEIHQEVNQRALIAYSHEPPETPRQWLIDTVADGLVSFLALNPLGYLLARDSARRAMEIVLRARAGGTEELRQELIRAGMQDSPDGKVALRQLLAGAGSLTSTLSEAQLVTVFGQARPAFCTSTMLMLDLPAFAVADREASERVRRLARLAQVLARESVFLKLFLPHDFALDAVDLFPHPICLEWSTADLEALALNREQKMPYRKYRMQKEDFCARLAQAAHGSPRRLVYLANTLAGLDPGSDPNRTFEAVLSS